MDINPNDYEAVLSQLSLGSHKKVPHLNCSASSCLRIGHAVEGMTFYCFKCRATHYVSMFNSPAERAKRTASFKAYEEAKASASFDLPLDFSHSIAPKGLAWLGSGGWTLDMFERYNVGWSEYLQRVVIPVSDQGYIARAVESWQRPKYLEKVKTGIMWESQSVHTTDVQCVVNEDILSAGRCGEFMKAYALLGTSLDTKQLSVLMKYDVIYIWLDPDKGGLDGTKSMINRLRLFSRVVWVKSDRDPKLLTDKEIRGLLCV